MTQAIGSAKPPIRDLPPVEPFTPLNESRPTTSVTPPRRSIQTSFVGKPVALGTCNGVTFFPLPLLRDREVRHQRDHDTVSGNRLALGRSQAGPVQHLETSRLRPAAPHRRVRPRRRGGPQAPRERAGR